MMVDWYLMRSSGVVALMLLTAVIILGVASRSKWRPSGRSRAMTRQLHRNMSLVAVTFVVIHVLTALIHPEAAVSLIDVVVPFGAGVHPFAVGMGTLAIDVILAILVSTLLRPLIGTRAWRGVHVAAYVLWPIALLHVLPIATDIRAWWFGAVIGGATMGYIAAVAWRRSMPARPQPFAASRSRRPSGIDAQSGRLPSS